VKAIARNVNDYWMKHGRPDRLVMSFHGLPKVEVQRGDPYQGQCLASAEAIARELGWNDARTLVTFQSRFGAQEWLQPYTDKTLERLGREGVGRVDVVCPGFAADCLETLEEIAQYRLAELRKALGVTQVELAELIGKSQSAISQIESGEIGLSLDVLRTIVAELGGTLEVAAVFNDRRVLLDA